MVEIMYRDIADQNGLGKAILEFSGKAYIERAIDLKVICRVISAIFKDSVKDDSEDMAIAS